MSHINWSVDSLLDLERLEAFLFDKDPDAAFRARQTIRQRVLILEHQPRLGRPADHLPLAYREWPIRFGSSGYVALYRVDKDQVTILAIRHMREVGFDHRDDL
jgi:plasmid stabilization system protein ParE